MAKMSQAEYLKYIQEQQSLLDPLSTVASAFSGIGNMWDNVSEQRDLQNIGREDLANSVIGNTWSDIFNNQDRLAQGMRTVDDNRIDVSEVNDINTLANIGTANNLQDNVTAGTSDGGDIFADAGEGAKIGASLGSIIPGVGTAIGAGIGLGLGAISGTARSIIGDINNKKNARALNERINQANAQQINDLYDRAGIINQKQLRQNMMNYFAKGGSLEELNKVTKIGAGDTHEHNPNNGVQMGVAPDNLPNLVEENEVVYKDYVYSNRLKPNKSLLKQYNLPEKYAGKTFAELAEILQKESEDRPHDPVSLQTLNDWMSRLQNAQEEYKVKQEERRLAKAIDNMSDEEKAAIMSSLVQPMAQQEGIDLSQPMYAKGGEIHIAKNKRGTFTAAAKKHGKSVQAFASQVLANKENYSPAMVKKANFARNAAKWSHKHDLGGINDVVFKDLVPPDLSRSFAQYILPIDQTYTQYLPQVLTGNVINTAPGFGGINHSTTFAGEDINDTINIPKPITESNNNEGTVNTDLLARRLGESLRYAPALGAALGALEARLQPKDYALANELRDIASQYQPVSATHIGGYRRYTPYDVNLGDAENIALTARALESNRGQNRATQGALNTAVLNAAQKTAAARNLAAQQANEANRLATDTYNLGVDQFNAQRDTQYDQLNQQILNNRLRTLMSAAQAEDDSRIAWAQNVSSTTENMYNQLGNVGRDNWNRNQRDIYLRDLGYDPVALLSLLNLNRG